VGPAGAWPLGGSAKFFLLFSACFRTKFVNISQEMRDIERCSQITSKLVCGPFSQLGRGLGDPSEDTSYLAQATREIFVWKLDDLNGVAAARSGPKILPASNAALCLNNDEEEAKDDLSLRRQLSEDQIEPATEMIRGCL
jgi:hypothetical protein